MERTWGNLVTPVVVEGLLGGVHGCWGGGANLCSGDFENVSAGVSANPGSFSGRDKIDDTVVNEDALDDVDENEWTELPEVDLEDEDEMDDPEPDRDDVELLYEDEADVEKEKVDDPYWDGGRMGMAENDDFEVRMGVTGAVGDWAVSKAPIEVGVSSRR